MLDTSSHAFADAGCDVGHTILEELVGGLAQVLQDVAQERLRERHAPPMSEAEMETARLAETEDAFGLSNPGKPPKNVKTLSQLGVSPEDLENALSYNEMVRQGLIEPQ